VPDLYSPAVCLVDDDASVRKSLTRLLDSAGFTVESFSEPETFLAYLVKHSVRLAILDIWMDSMTGMELLAHLCARSPSTRVIFVTGHEDHAAETTVMQAGAFAFFIKPFDNARFLGTVQRALNQTSPEKNSEP
jgi:FixJ family two-component response regulator